ncbi:right-handed parallel beta-helix repeat-containing protein, partial [bacterium]|nr:right-handed parallel beta-helix repeat-containing protein [bacterium]
MRLSFCILALLNASLSFGVTITGVALLEGETDHSGIEVWFGAVSPSAETDSAFTNSLGNFAVNIEPGFYDVCYSKPGFETITFRDQVLFVDTNLSQVVLTESNPSSGDLIGSIGPGVIQISNHIRVPNGRYLEIAPGTRVEFTGPYRFTVEGTLTAIGTEQDSIVFTATDSSVSWDGILLVAFSDASVLEYCKVKYANEIGYMGGGISILSSNANIHRCTIQHCDGGNYGGGLYIRDASPTIDQCVIEHNEAYAGGGIHMSSEASPVITDCVIRNNSANRGGGILVGSDTNGATITGCSIHSNSATTGGGVELLGPADISFIENDIYDNHADHSGGGLFAGSSSQFIRCSIWNNSAGYGSGGAYIAGGSPEFLNCTIDGNCSLDYTDAVLTNCIIRGYSSNTLSFYRSSASRISYCCIWTGNGDPIGFIGDDSTYAPPFIGKTITTNINEDSCDTYLNIFEDPLFIDAENGNYHLREGSPCIDAGDPNLPYDPDGTIADIGAFYFPQQQSVD